MKKEEVISMLEADKPTATIFKVEDGKVVYRTTIIDRTMRIPVTQAIFFHIPFADIKGNMENVMKVDELIKWLV